MIDPNIKSLQAALKALGADPGSVDGIDGPKTRAAAVAWGQGATSKPAAPVGVASGLPWYAEATRLIGTKEAAGVANSPAIMAWAKDAQIGGYTGDDVPWCGLFVAHCFHAGLPSANRPENPLGARNWLKFGREVKPQIGAVMVFWRGSRDGWSGHVGFYHGESATTYSILGGNQSDAVTVTTIAKDRFLGARWPDGYPASGETAAVAGGALSTNEA